MKSILEVRDLSISFGGLRAVDHFRLTLGEGELVGLIGPNGAGKTTVFNMLTGIYRPTSGRILFRGRRDEEPRDITDLKPHQITSRGIARTFQNIRLLKGRSVLENVLIAYHYRVPYSLLDAVFRTGRYYHGERALVDEAMEFLSIFGIEGKARELAQNLPYGEQRKLEIVRALATHPVLLLLDEPAAGMNPKETRALMDLIRFIRERFSLTILLIEHDMSLVMNVCERIVVLDYGRIIAEGDPESIRRNPEVIKAYLGEEVEIA
ncbi:ABC transporter ATP-binding protein [Spirochaeta thermophila]|uniref:Branched-chain amino acid ABC transporter, ATP-binding protein n=1 Tax=Winmispira thermophila (strain ATCC 49972 / DSM 6192 / RI 19.B1) TaxID=665571 RepID=E0RPY6_WINT6|nr:ABC transporter ATP-binding protein [Spirochaeta thermophila]ADN02839.1 branched-chain amino acid ABC transporter, ATP-binding protein [Spirochaeta thermophila DSM 6192]